MNTDISIAMYQNAYDKKSQMNDDEEIAHPFFTHMDIPVAMGTYSFPLAASATRMHSKTMSDFASILKPVFQIYWAAYPQRAVFS